MTTMHMNDPLVGHVLEGRYEITSRIARGGMATVYVAEDTRLMRTVAVKVMHEGLGDDDDFSRKFDREARAAARLIHPNIVAVFDQGHDAGRPYIVMEHVAGQTLRSLISREAPMPPAHALALMEPILSALATAHENGFVHRDVKPENVLISERGHVKVADFGLAKAISGDTVTATQGLLIGTVSYIPPEVVAEGRADAHSDVYSAGVVLYELLTGRKPHTGDSPIQVAYAHCNKDVPAPSLVEGRDWLTDDTAIPPYVDALVRAATRRDPDDRLPDARVFLDRLRLARHALERGVRNDPRLDLAMARNPHGDADTQPLVSPVEPPQPTRWAPRPQTAKVLPATPISPVDVGSRADAIPFYDALPAAQRTPVERSLRIARPATIAQPAPAPGRKRRGSSAARPARKGRGRGVAALLLFLLLLTGVGYGAWYTLAGQYSPMPTLAGETRDEAFAAASEAHLTITFTDEYSEDVPAGEVIRTAPEAGSRVRSGGHVEAFLSRGPERLATPRLVGLTRSLAEEAIRGAGLALGTVTESFDDRVAAGTVTGASLAEGVQVARDTSVDLTVSKGPAPISITSFAGRATEEAKAALTRVGLVVKVVEENSKTVPKGSVISQDPANGQLRRGDTVTLVSSQGPVMVTVPQTRGMQQAAAREALEAKGFVVAVKQLPNPVPFGTVSYSDPNGGTQLAEGSTVTIYVA